MSSLHQDLEKLIPQRLLPRPDVDVPEMFIFTPEQLTEFALNVARMERERCLAYCWTDRATIWAIPDPTWK